jgi:sigma-E factor negative regulatory protein RseB
MPRPGVLFLLSLMLVVAQSRATTTSSSDASQSDESFAWLAKARVAAQQIDYTGTFVYQQGPLVRTSRITHIRKQQASFEKLESLDGQARETIRNGDEIICYLPAERRLIVESRGTERAFPALPGARPEQIAFYYRARKTGSARVAGRDAQSIALEPKDTLRYGYRLWADKSSGLLLRVQTISEKGEVVEQIAFTELRIGPIPTARAKASFTDTRGWRIENTLISKLDLSRWNVKWMPAGFRQIRALKRVVADHAAKQPNSQKEISQLVYSDGLAGISIFIEPWSAQRTAVPAQQGALNMVGKQHGNFWLTIVGEVPMGAIQQIADSIELTATK